MKNPIGNLFKGDKAIWMVFFLLCLVSVIEVFSASSSLMYKTGNYMSPVLKHSGILMMGLVAMIITLNIKCKYFKILTPFMWALSLFFLIWALLWGHSENDASRWVDLGLFKFQPSEVAKGALVLMTAQILSATQTENGADKRAFYWILGMSAPLVLLIMKENLSTALLISITIYMMMVIGRIPANMLGISLGVVMIFIALAISSVLLFGDAKEDTQSQQALVEQFDPQTGQKIEVKKEKGVLHRMGVWKGRILTFFNSDELPPDSVDLNGKGAQSAHSNIAIASSGITGVGPGNSVERDFLSQAFSDFIFAIIIEELGIGGAFAIAFLYVILLFRTGRIADRCENNFPAFLAMGLALMLVIQALFNMCVAVGLVPVTGQPLPLISKGGTSSVINCIYIGVILSISRSAKKRT